MIYLDRPIGIIEGLQIFRDHADGNLFHYVKEGPRLAMNNGEPEFVFLKYARDITDNPDFKDNDAIGGGLLAFTVDLGADEATLTRVKGQLIRYSDGGPVALSPIFFESGTVRLAMISDNTDDEEAAADAEQRGIRIFEETWGATTPSLFGNNRATFGVTLGHEAAQLMEASLKAGIGYIGVIYDLAFLGMRPAFNVKVTADYKRIYNHFEGELAGQANVYGVMLQAEIGIGFQKLVDQGAIKIEVTTFTDNADLVAQAQAAKDWAIGKITEDIFRSSLQPPSFMTRSSSSPLEALGRLAGALAGGLGGRDPRDTIASQPASQTSAHRDERVARRTRRDEAPPPDLSGRDHVENPTDEPEGSGAPAADDATGNSESGQAPVTERPASEQPADEAGGGDDISGTGESMYPYKVGLSIRYYRQEELKTRVFEFNRQAAERRRIAPQGLFSTVIDGRRLDDRIIEVNLDSDFFKRLNLEVRTATDWDHEGIELSTVSVEYPGSLSREQQPSHADGYAFSKEDEAPKRFMSFLNEQKDMSYRYKTEVHFKSNSQWIGRDQVVRSDWHHTRVRPLTINALDNVGLMEIAIAADTTLFAANVSQAIVDLEYNDEGNQWNVSERFVLDSEHPSHSWKLRLIDRSQRSYRYTVEYFLEGNVRYKTSPVVESEPNLVISSPFRNKKKIRLVPMRDTDGILEAIVDVAYNELDHGYRQEIQKVFSPDNLTSLPIEFDTLSAVPKPFSYRITIVRNDGTFFESDEISSEASVIPVTAGAGNVHRINARLAVDASMLSDYYAVELLVQETSGDIESEVFVPSDAEGDRSRLKRLIWITGEEDLPMQYKWRWIAYLRDGTTQQADWSDGTDDELIVTIH